MFGSVIFTFPMSDLDSAIKVAAILQDYYGKLVLSIPEVEVPGG